MPEQALQLPWERPGWFKEVSVWIQAELNRRTVHLTGSIEPFKVRLWSAVLRVPTDNGHFYFKAASPVSSHEPGLVLALSRWRPDCLPQVTAVDQDRGWMLMPDGGRPMRDFTLSEKNIRRWRQVLPLYADVQIEMAGRIQDLLALGAYDRRLAAMPELYERLLDDHKAVRVGRPDGLTVDEYDRLRRLTPQFSALCRELASYRLPETLEHGDFHDNNILVRSEVGGASADGYTFFDWGDSCVTHPFVSLFVALNSVAYHLEMDHDAPELQELRDLYLAQWSRFGSKKKLLAAFELAMRVGMIVRALTFDHFFSAASGPDVEEFASAIPELLKEFLEAMTRPDLNRW